MKRTMRILAATAAIASIAGCGTQGKAVKPDQNGYLPTGNQIAPDKAKTLVAEKFDAGRLKPLAVVTANDFAVEQVRDLGYFGEVINRAELERRIVAKGLQDKVPSLSDALGFSNAARNYGNFMWIHFDANKRDGKGHIRLIATDPSSLHDVFVAELELVNPMLTWNGYNDQNTWYPLFNSMIDWLKTS